ncbi:hypothetical protein P8452_76392 [Trifolium repens]|nr:hypothetical protein P8452_76392 [Trifolium repens]
MGNIFVKKPKLADIELTRKQKAVFEIMEEPLEA